MSKRALARKITWKEARSYRRLTPNPLGVTAIAAVNGRRAYAKRYARARTLFGRPVEEGMISNKRGKKPARKRSAVRRRSRRPPVAATVVTVEGKAGSRAVKRAAKKAAKRLAKAESRVKKAAKKAVKKVRMAAAKVRRPVRHAAKSVKRRAVRSPAAVRATHQRSVRARRKRSFARATAKPWKVFGGAFYAPKVRVGGYVARQSYMYETPTGGMSKVPEYAILGYGSAREYRAALNDPEEREQIARRKEKIAARRERAAEALRARGGVFWPNRKRGARSRTLSFKQWSSGMVANKGKKARGRKAAGRKRTTKRTRTTRRRRVARVAPKRRRTTKRRVLRVAPKRRRTTKRRRPATRRRRTAHVAPKRRRTIRRRHVKRTVIGLRKTYRLPRRVRKVEVKLYSKNRRRGRRAHRIPATFYRRNALLSGSYKDQLLESLKLGAVALAGLLGHRVLSRLIKGFIPQLNDSAYGELIAGAGVAALGVPLVVKFAPADAKLLGLGMMVSLGVQAVGKLLEAVDTGQKIAPYLAGYGDRVGPARSLGSYYEYYPGQRMSGLGEYYAPPCLPGQSNVLSNVTQQAAGFGRITEAAAGMGALRQAAAGVGELRQAAAGYGEYVGTDLEGIGDYVEVVPEYTRPVATEDGIRPTLNEAERALNIAEQANGVGGTDQTLAAQWNVEPEECTEAVGFEPEGERSGVLAGKDGIFGPLQ